MLCLCRLRRCQRVQIVLFKFPRDFGQSSPPVPNNRTDSPIKLDFYWSMFTPALHVKCMGFTRPTTARPSSTPRDRLADVAAEHVEE